MTAFIVSLCVICSIMLLGQNRPRPAGMDGTKPPPLGRPLSTAGSRGSEHVPVGHENAATALRQLAALLQSGRTPGQAWSDLRDHWQKRRGAEHPLTALASCVAASEAMGRGTVEGLQRGREAILERRRSSKPRLSSSRSAEPDAPWSRLPASVPLVGPVIASALLALRREPDGAEVTLLVRIVDKLIGIAALSERTGAPLARLLEQAASSVEDEAQVEAAVKTAVAGPRLTQLLLTALPLGGLVLGQLMGSGGIMFFLTSPWGPLCGVIGIGLLGLGYLWSAQLIRKVRHDG